MASDSSHIPLSLTCEYDTIEVEATRINVVKSLIHMEKKEIKFKQALVERNKDILILKEQLHEMMEAIPEEERTEPYEQKVLLEMQIKVFQMVIDKVEIEKQFFKNLLQKINLKKGWEKYLMSRSTGVSSLPEGTVPMMEAATPQIEATVPEMEQPEFDPKQVAFLGCLGLMPVKKAKKM